MFGAHGGRNRQLSVSSGAGLGFGMEVGGRGVPRRSLLAVDGRMLGCSG